VLGVAANTPSYDVLQGAERGLLPRPKSRHRPERMQPVAYLYLLPVIVSAIIFTIGPFLYTIYISFTNYNRLRNFQEFDWIGWRNYERVFESGSDFFPVLGWTFGFMVLTTLFNVGFGGFLALLLNHERLTERNIYRTLLIIPWALPFILLVQVWSGIFNSDGPINRILSGLGLNTPIWLGNTADVTAARAALLITNLWFSYPFFMTVCLAALQAISRELYEAAELDGAGSWARFRDITIPFMRTAVTPLLITQAAYQFNNAAIIVLLTKGQPIAKPGDDHGTTDTLASFAYQLLFRDGRYGLAAAYSVIIFIVIASLTIANSVATKSFKEAN
jgi:arabinogalactan oligomer/maltooligosaccharide transport system permease protein